MKALFVALTLLTSLSVLAQTGPAVVPGPQVAPPGGQPTGSAPPVSAGLRGEPEFRRDRRGTPVVITREEMEQRLARLENLLGQALERSRRWEGRALLDDAYRELGIIQDMLEDAPVVRDNNPGPVPPRGPPPPPAYQPISDGRMQQIMNAMSRESFAKDKLNVLQSASGGDSYFLVGQVQQVLGQFQFSKDRLAAVRMLWPRVLDRQNGFQLNSAFQFSADKEELKRIISG